jgi:hypothetical protein
LNEANECERERETHYFDDENHIFRFMFCAGGGQLWSFGLSVACLYEFLIPFRFETASDISPSIQQDFTSESTPLPTIFRGKAPVKISTLLLCEFCSFPSRFFSGAPGFTSC